MTNIVAFRGHENPVWDVKWSPMGIYFATASRDRTARLWSTDRISALRVYAGHLSDVDVRTIVLVSPSYLIFMQCLQFHPNSLYIATGSSDRTARLWDVQRGSCVRVFIGHQGSISSMAISPDGRYLASAGKLTVGNDYWCFFQSLIRRGFGHQSLGPRFRKTNKENDWSHLLHIFVGI
jgi:transcription initiation factor TFIID subunit 5